MYYVRQNSLRDKLLAEGEVQDAATDEFADKTDLQLPGFRYVVSGLMQYCGLSQLTYWIVVSTSLLLVVHWM